MESRNMRVLHINCNYIGTALHQHMIENLDRLGYENRVFVPTYDRNLSVIVPNDNVSVCECFKKWDRVLFDYKQKKIRRAVEQTYTVSDFDLIHAYTLFTDGNCARILSEKYHIPFVVAIRNTDVNNFFRQMPHLRHRGVKTMLCAKAVFFLSEAYRRQVFENYIPKKYWKQIEKKTFIIPNGIDDFWFENCYDTPKSLSDKKKIRLIYAGKIDKNKNISATQQAMALLREKGYEITFTVVGKAMEKAVFESIVKDPFTTYFPAMPKEKLIEKYRDSDIFVMPSFTESFGLVYAEAMSQGLPVVYSKGQGFDNQFPEGTVGYHVSPYDVRDIADGIEKVVENYDKIKNNVVFSAKSFNWSEISEKYDKIYRA